MPLSRNFYSLDEVQAALLYSTTRNTSEEALFWCKEMLLSGCVAETISTLFQSWLWHTGPMRLQWLIQAWTTLGSEQLTEDDILLSTHQLCSISYSERDNSLWNILCSILANPDKIPDRVTNKTPHSLPSDDPKEIYFIRAIYQKKARCAWWISQYINNERIWELITWYVDTIINEKHKNENKICIEALQEYEKLLGYKSAEYDISIRCMGVIMLCMSHGKQDTSFRPLNNDINLTGFKEGRAYSIPSICLYGKTVRGQMKWTQNNFTQLNNFEKYLVGCPFWDETLTEYADVNEDGAPIWHSDDKQEEFYEKFFPDDIPDEWSKLEKLKSHGDGIIGPTDVANIWKYSRTYMNKLPHLAWNTTKMVEIYLKGVGNTDCSIETLLQSYSGAIEFPMENLKKLEPVRKVKLVTI